MAQRATGRNEHAPRCHTMASGGVFVWRPNQLAIVYANVRSTSVSPVHVVAEAALGALS